MSITVTTASGGIFECDTAEAAARVCHELHAADERARLAAKYSPKTESRSTPVGTPGPTAGVGAQGAPVGGDSAAPTLAPDVVPAGYRLANGWRLAPSATFFCGPCPTPRKWAVFVSKDFVSCVACALSVGALEFDEPDSTSVLGERTDATALGTNDPGEGPVPGNASGATDQPPTVERVTEEPRAALAKGAVSESTVGEGGHAPPGFRIAGRSGPTLRMPSAETWVRFARSSTGTPDHDADPHRWGAQRPAEELWDAGCYDVLEPIPAEPASTVGANEKTALAVAQSPAVVPTCKAWCGQPAEKCGATVHPCLSPMGKPCACSRECAAAGRPLNPPPPSDPVTVATGGFYVEDTTCRGDSTLWWKPNRNGYTVSLDDAGIYPATFVPPRPTDRLVPVDVARKLGRPVVSRDELGIAMASASKDGPVATEASPAVKRTPEQEAAHRAGMAERFCLNDDAETGEECARPRGHDGYHVSDDGTHSWDQSMGGVPAGFRLGDGWEPSDVNCDYFVKYGAHRSKIAGARLERAVEMGALVPVGPALTTHDATGPTCTRCGQRIDQPLTSVPVETEDGWRHEICPEVAPGPVPVEAPIPTKYDCPCRACKRHNARVDALLAAEPACDVECEDGLLRATTVTPAAAPASVPAPGGGARATVPASEPAERPLSEWMRGERGAWTFASWCDQVAALEAELAEAKAQLDTARVVLVDRNRGRDAARTEVEQLSEQLAATRTVLSREAKASRVLADTACEKLAETRADAEQWKGWTAEARAERDAANERASETGCELDGVRAEVEGLRAKLAEAGRTIEAAHVANAEFFAGTTAARAEVRSMKQTAADMARDHAIRARSCGEDADECDALADAIRALPLDAPPAAPDAPARAMQTACADIAHREVARVQRFIGSVTDVKERQFAMGEFDAARRIERDIRALVVAAGTATDAGGEAQHFQADAIKAAVAAANNRAADALVAWGNGTHDMRDLNDVAEWLRRGGPAADKGGE